MENKTMLKAAALMVVIVLTTVGSYEYYLRTQGVDIAYDDGPALWSDKRAQVYGPSDKNIVFIGSSRIKYDLDIPTWNNGTGFNAIQLAIEGSTPIPILRDLANDRNFRGRLVVDITEPLVFMDLPPFQEKPTKCLSYYHDRTLAQKASFELNHLLESQLVFLNKESLSLNAQLDALHIPNRPGVFTQPVFPLGFVHNDFSRQSAMTDDFVADTIQVNEVRNIWKMMFSGPPPPQLTDQQIKARIMELKTYTDAIIKRGGSVVFVRTPSTGPFLQIESVAFSRQKFWDQILKITGCQGIHFQDDVITAKLPCPEFSHLSRPDAKIYTKRFIARLSQIKGWETVRPNQLLTQK